MLFVKFRKSKISWYKQEQLIEHFIAGKTARCASELLGMNRNMVTLYFRHLQEIIACELEQQSEELFGGEIEVDESYFGGTQKGKRGHVQKPKPQCLACLKGVARFIQR